MIIIVINFLPNMTFFTDMLFVNSTNSRDLPIFGQISLFFSTKILKSPGFENFRLTGLELRHQLRVFPKICVLFEGITRSFTAGNWFMI